MRTASKSQTVVFSKVSFVILMAWPSCFVCYLWIARNYLIPAFMSEMQNVTLLCRNSFISIQSFGCHVQVRLGYGGGGKCGGLGKSCPIWSVPWLITCVTWYGWDVSNLMSDDSLVHNMTVKQMISPWILSGSGASQWKWTSNFQLHSMTWAEL